MSHGNIIIRPTYFFINRSTLTEIKPFSWNKSTTYYVHVTITSNNRFLLMLEFKNDQLFVEKTKLANNLYMEHLNHLSRNKSPTNYVQQVISKITKE